MGDVCLSVGNMKGMFLDMDPSGNGIRITYYHGAATSAVTFKQSTIYFECTAKDENALVFEHEKVCGYGDQTHFSFTSKLACPNNI
jgi:hypothetical protein